MSNKPPLVSVRQGDILLIKRDQAPDNLVPIPAENGRLALARGEATGHHHSLLATPQIALFRPDDMPASSGIMWLRLGEPTELKHQEHLAIQLDLGVYERRPQLEWSDDLEPRVVSD